MTAKKLMERIRYWSQLLLLPVYWFSFCVPRDKNIWLFGSTFGRRFADNPRYLYLYVSQHSERSSEQIKTEIETFKQDNPEWEEDINCKDIRAIWISHDKEIVSFLQKNGYEAYYYHSFRGIWYALRAKVYIFDNYSKDINFWQSGGAVKVNLWHGVGNKRINYDNVHDKIRHPQNLWEKWKSFPRRLSDEKPSHYILATSPTMSKIFARAFQVPMAHVIEAGYPRNDILVGRDTIDNLYTISEEKVIYDIREKKKQGYSIDLYMPTFRDSEEKFFEIMNLEEFNQFLQRKKIIFLIKIHTKSKLKQRFEEQRFSNIMNIPAEVDPHSILLETDILTTDYSSIYSDYTLLHRPVVGFPYDYEIYAKETRESYFDFKEYMPELQAYTMEELINYTMLVLESDIQYKEREKTSKIMFKYKDGNASRRIVEEIVKIGN